MSGFNTIGHMGVGLSALSSDKPSLNHNDMNVTSSSFQEAFQSALRRLEEGEQSTNAAVVAFANGAPLPLHEVLLRAEETQLNLALAVEVRNKAVEAYQEIMRMPI